VHRWRRGTSGRAWQGIGPDGTPVNFIESPEPTSELTLAIFLHEIGHHKVGLDGWELDSEAEYWAWDWAFGQMENLGINPTSDVYARYDLSLRYAVHEERRRGVLELPPCLRPFIPQAA
jgi:hypothetical protein